MMVRLPRSPMAAGWANGVAAFSTGIDSPVSAASAPGLRAEVDLLTRDADGTLFAPEGLEEALQAGFREAGFDVHTNDTYFLHPATLGHRWSVTYPGQVLSLEVRRDLLVEAWRWDEEMLPVPEKVARVAQVLAPALARRLAPSPRP